MSCLWFNPIALPFALLLMMLYRLFSGSSDTESTVAYALALLFIAIIVRGLLLPFQMKSKRGMLKQTRLQPKIAELQKKHGANKQKLNEEMAKLYKEEGVNPASGCLWSFIQMPIMFALFYAIRQPISLMMRLESDLWLEGRSGFNTTGKIYTKFMELINQGVISIPERLLDAETGFFRVNDFYVELYIAQDISTHWAFFKNIGLDGLERISFYLGSINLSEVPQWNFFMNTDWSNPSIWGPALILFLLPVMSGGAQFISAAIMRKTTPQQTPEAGKGTGGTIMKLMPLMSVWFGFILPAALSIYWTIGTGLQIAQDIWLNKRYTKILDEEDYEREQLRKEKEAEIEAKRLETERMKAEGLIVENPNTSKRKKQKTERQEQREKAAQWEKKNAPAGTGRKDAKDEPGRVGDRRFARGRAYVPDRFERPEDSRPDEGSRDENDSYPDSGTQPGDINEPAGAGDNTSGDDTSGYTGYADDGQQPDNNTDD